MAALRVLGPLALADGSVAVGSARQRRLLAALALRLDEPVPVDLLAELVWGATPPADPAGAVQTNVARLRRLLPPGLVVETTPRGYRLRADRTAVDAAAFTDLLDGLAADGHDPAARLAVLDAALALWRGRPFADLDHPTVEPEVARLDELHRHAVEERATALLEAGRPADAVAALEPLVRAEPLRERAVGVLMRALVAAGRQAEALDAYAALRTRLAEELGLDPSPELRELEGRVLRQELAPPPTAPPPSVAPGRTASPRPPANSFVGRSAELALAAELLDRSRLVTLTGPGGVGKTRLARHVAAEAGARYPDGVLLVELGDGGPDDVESALAGLLRIIDADAGSLRERIVEVLAPRRLLLVLDNCEHVVERAAALAEAVVAGAPGVDVLATGREALRIDAEQCLPVAPLGPPDAARLLADRIRAGDPAAVVDGALVDEICARLDGLPLALELAAARALPLGLAGLVEALDRPLDVLRGGRRTAAARHRSLRDVVAWSYGLLDEEQRTLFDRMAVFAGPVEPAAVEAVCGDAAALPDLVERSLVVRRGTRFTMLETLRAFGRSRIAERAEGPGLRARHAAWAAGLAAEVSRARRGPGEAEAVRRFDAHLADLRRAHAWLVENGPRDDLLRLAGLFAELGYLRCRIDLVDPAEEALRAAGVVGADGRVATRRLSPAAARTVYFVACACWQRGDLDLAAAHADALTALGFPAHGHELFANLHTFAGRLSEARTAADAARAALRTTPRDDPDGPDDHVVVAALVDRLLCTTYARGDDTGADPDTTALEAELAGVAARSGAPTVRAWGEYAQGEHRTEQGDPGAGAHLRAAVALAEEADSTFVAGIARHTLLTSAVRHGDAPLAELRPLLEHWHRSGSWTHTWVAIRALIEALSRLGRHAEAATLLGALRASPRATPAFGPDLDRERRVEAAARTALGPRLEAALTKGAGLDDAAAFALALRLTGAPGPGPSLGT
ncbi:BTAD domain-containing putative transcriptional regulator [Pseudonocardia halophobica]|uniref:SARP family transcriptional regulator n=1 Tax=Pseudonocardia halophobica TaxID=29401 RepID=A0A9W6L590_9PSEU|nr:BTAD domain-containing putative transcriptional regulator [Pseudonocardia halophobica]GLL13170.1 SARP family transcriptional regulator [Pseudonocardia halophobica]